MSVSALRAAPGTAPAHRWLVLAVLALAQLMDVMDATIVNVALPSTQADLGFSNADRQWIVTAYALTFGAFLLLGGRIADLVGAKTTLLVGLLGFAAASAVGGATHSFGVLVATRALQGAFGALVAPSVLALITVTFVEPRDRSKAFGIFGAIAGTGAAVGLMVGGLLTQHLSWRWGMYVNVPIALVSFVGALLLVRGGRPDRTTRLDLPGAVTAVIGLAALVYGFDHANLHGWGDATTVTLIVGAVAVLALFVVLQAVRAHPLLPLRIVTDRLRGGALFMIGMTPIAMFAVFLFLVYYLQQNLGFSPVRSGAAFLPMIAGVIASAGATSAGPLSRIPPRLLMAPGAFVAAAGMLLLSTLTVDSSYAGHVLPGLLISGLGMGLIFGVGINAATAGVRPSDSGVASAAVNAVQQVAGALGVALLNTVVARTIAAALPSGRPPTPGELAEASIAGDTRAFLIGAVIMIGTGVIGYLLLPAGRLTNRTPVPTS